MKHLLTICLFLTISSKGFSCDSLFIKYHVVVRKINNFDSFYKISVTNLENNDRLQIFSLIKPTSTNYKHNISIGDTLYICLLPKQVLKIASGFIISYHPQSKWIYQRKVILGENEVPFISCNLNNLTYSDIDCCNKNN